MIYVDRHRRSGSRVIQPSADWFEEARRLTDKAIREGAAHEVTDHYKHAEVKMALEELFYDKCVYCESRPTASSPWDVEHYRPKGRIAERPDHDGYYWLAYDWENLLPACKFCNQRRKDQPRYHEPRVLPAQGKLDQFPIGNEDDRAMSPTHNLKKERPYLLNPTVDEPEDHLTYDIQGQIHSIEENDLRATETIRICHLRRRRLRDDRARTVMWVSKAMRNLRLAREAGETMAEQFMEEMIADCVAADALYAGAARAVKRDPDAFIAAPPT